ncbi:MAG: hypothetical protein AAGI24_14605 [Pseudomonadota bacterium]
MTARHLVGRFASAHSLGQRLAPAIFGGEGLRVEHGSLPDALGIATRLRALLFASAPGCARFFML